MAFQHDPFAGLPMRTAIATFAPPTDDRLRFIKQLGVDDLIIWGTTFHAPTGGRSEPAVARPPELGYKELVALRSRVEDAGLRLFAIENVPLPWYDQVIFGGPDRDRQIAHYQNTIRNMGRVGIPVLGYNWAPSGVWRSSFTFPLRGGARGTAYDSTAMTRAPLTHGREFGEDELWDNLGYFLERVLPVAEAEGVKLAAHPNDPPVEHIGGVACLLRSWETFQQAMDLVPSPNHGLTFCLGGWSEMGADLLAAIDHFGKQNKLFYVHFQAVNGSVPSFNETFVDAADYDPYAVLMALKEVGFNGVMIPGHVPQIEGDSEWRTAESAAYTPYNHPMGGHRARAYTIGFLKGLLYAIQYPEGAAARRIER